MTAFMILFIVVYECNAHYIISPFMVSAFVPFLIGWIVWSVINKKNKKVSRSFVNCFNAANITLTAGLVMRGVLDIYGTSNELIWLYFIAGAILMIIAVFTGIFSKNKSI